MTNSSFRAPSLDYHIGDEAYANASTHDLKYILNSGQISDWESMEKYWHQSIHNYLSVDPANHRFILTEPPSNTPENREMMAEIMFETFGVKGLFIGVQAALALYAQVTKNSGGGGLGDLGSAMTGTVIDAGDGVTHVFPVCDGYVIGSCVKSIPLAGRDITKFILRQLNEREEPFPPEDGMEIASVVKERFGYCCVDMQKEYAKFDKKESEADDEEKII